ncbi:conserved hypothetical protein [Histoplasma mississippiense (nom. inval.)]|uniref:conserved hypothetical protein n=1 Tax=Ajellomyces capsulatus (strain NAm1 / WU24) TaxID=2059318 RepID=UPI000157BB8D|nr:conserved hypothetical protein [Histoplasma mississippiense (nom. inval.)]EDN05605.1 conserved hypothetical protein [Histoplasma mississippiense (nom. inval.)]
MESRGEENSEFMRKASDTGPSNKSLPERESQESNLEDEDARLAALSFSCSDPLYEAKAQLLNEAILDIGMGRYQWQLFIVIGFGWASDNLWPIVTSLIFTPVRNEFSPSHPPLLTLAQNLGLLAGAVFWGFGCDIYGRRWAFNLTIGITAVFGLVAASSPNFAAIAVFAALWSFGVGGNLPVDSAIFLEFLPSSHQFLLTVLSVDWALAQVLGGLSMVMFFIRFACFTIFESPKYLMGTGKDEDAIRVVHEVARRNGRESSLTLEALTSLGHGTTQGEGARVALQRKLEKLDSSHLKSLFATPKLAWSTSLITLIWALIGLGFPLYNAFLPYIQSTRGANFGDGSTNITYRNSLIIAVLGIPGCFIGGSLVETRSLGRRGTLGLSTTLTGIFLLASTTATTSNALLGWNCAYSFMSNIMYAVLYAYTPEIFPTKDRGTGNALTAAANRVFGVLAPVVAMLTDLDTAVPVYMSGALFIIAGALAIVLPFESRGRASL